MRELAALSILGAVTKEESSALDAHLSEGCAVCAREIRLAEEISVGLADAAATEPPPGLREKLLAKVTEKPLAPGVLFHEHQPPR
jgi:hypothetical protein